MSEARLLDTYIDALRRDPNAEPPEGLSPELAATVRAVVLAEQGEQPGPAALDRIWGRALVAAQSHTSSNGRNSDLLSHQSPLKKTEEGPMIGIMTRRQATVPRWGRRVALMAAALAVVVFGGFLLGNFMHNDTTGGPAAVFLSEQESNKQIFLRFIKEVWEEGNTDLIGDLVTDDFVRHESGVADMGQDALPAYVEGFRAAVPDGVNNIEDIIAEGDMVYARGVFTGTFDDPLALGPGMIAEPTGEMIAFDVMTSARFVDGRIAEQWVTTDSLSFMAQMNAVETPDVALTEQRNIATVTALIEEGLNQQDVDAYARYYVEDGSIMHIGDRPEDGKDSAAGRQEFISGWMLRAFPDLKMTILHIAAHDDYVMVNCAAQGTFYNALMKWNGETMPPTGEVEDWSWVLVYRLEDGLIAEEWWHFDFPWAD